MQETAPIGPPVPLASQPRLVRMGLLLLVLLTAFLWLSSRAILSANFLPHWYCFAGNTRVLWTTVLADLFIGLSYVVISASLVVIVRRAGRDLPYQGFFWAFGLFIVSCGVTHFLEILTVWKPLYWLSAAAKIITAVASVGTAVVLVIAAEDIVQFVLTARQMAARRGDQRFRALFNAAPLAVISFDLRGMITSWNPAAEKIFGYRERDVVGTANPIVPEELRDEHLRLLRNSLEGSVTYGYETVRRRRDGSRIAVNAYSAPLYDENARQIGIMAALEDISERKRMETDLQEKTEILSAVTQALNAYLESGDWNRAGRELLSFAVRKTGSAHGFLGLLLDDGTLRVLSEEGAVWDEPAGRNGGGLNALFAKVLRPGQPAASAPGGGDGLPPGFPVLQSVLGVPITCGSAVSGFLAVANREGGYTGREWESCEAMSHATGVVSDNYRQSLKRAALEAQHAGLEAQMRQAQKMEVLGRLAGGVAHDFNNMLMVLSGSAELLDRSLPTDALSRVYLEQIQRTVSKAATVTRQLLAFSRKQVLDIRPMNLHTALEESEAMLPRLLGADVALEFHARARNSWIRSDLPQIEQVIVNLAINARDAMPDGGRLSIATHNTAEPPRSAAAAAAPVPEWVVLSVEDEGHGMDPKTLAQIFEPFFTTKPAGKGTGLGLSTAYGIVRQSGGYIQVRSDVDRGSRFDVYFPAIEAPEAKPAPEDGGLLERSKAQATVLLVDDEPALRHAIAEILRESGYTVLEAPSSREALEIAREHPGSIDLLVSDVVMPGLRGPELHQLALEFQPAIQVLFMSGYAEGLPETQLPEGALFLQKPFSFAALLERLRVLAARGGPD